MFNAKDNPVLVVQELASVMKFVNEVMSKMKDDEKLSQDAMAGLQCLLGKIESSLFVCGEELNNFRKVSGPTGTVAAESPRKRDLKTGV